MDEILEELNSLVQEDQKPKEVKVKECQNLRKRAQTAVCKGEYTSEQVQEFHNIINNNIEE
jgi:hypothetical protein